MVYFISNPMASAMSGCLLYKDGPEDYVRALYERAVQSGSGIRIDQ